jgi:putative ABC transport system ATP-binding protein
MIELEKITKTFNAGKLNAFTAVKDIDRTIQSQKLTVFKGPSGSGKTTLLSIIGCMSRPTSGRIRLSGREITSLPERFTAAIRRKTFGFIFQNYHLIKGISVLENTMIPAFPDGQKYQHLRQRAMQLLQKLQIDSKAGQKVEYLSGGEQQRAAIARALINDPPYVIADEPTAHLDSELAGEFMDVIAELKRAGKTILIASHDPLVFESSIVDCLVTLKDGGIVHTEEAPCS